MGFEERQRLGKNIKLLNAANMKGIVQIIEEANAGRKNQKVLEFDLNTLEDLKCRQLEDYVNACLAKQKNEEIQKRREQEGPKPGMGGQGANFHEQQYMAQMGQQMGQQQFYQGGYYGGQEGQDMAQMQMMQQYMQQQQQQQHADQHQGDPSQN